MSVGLAVTAAVVPEETVPTVTVGVVPAGSLRAKFTPEALPGPEDLSGRILPEGLQDRREPSPGRSRCPSVGGDGCGSTGGDSSSSDGRRCACGVPEGQVHPEGQFHPAHPGVLPDLGDLSGGSLPEACRADGNQRSPGEIPVSVGLAVTAAAVPEETVPTVTVGVVPAGP